MLDTVSMPTIFQECFHVLQEELRPLHYMELTEKALQRLDLQKNDVNWSRQVEDIREKMLEAGQYGTFYIGKPFCLAGLRFWFRRPQLRLFKPTEGIFIAGNVSCGIEGAFETAMRGYFMTKKHASAEDERRFRAMAQGLVIEQHVSHYFKIHFPNFYQKPDNYHQWTKPCDHDFKLKVDNKQYKIDVTGKRLNGFFGNPGRGKKTVDFHLICEVIDDSVRLISVFSGKHYKGTIFPESGGYIPEVLLVWLNCLQAQLPYQQIKYHFLNQN